MSHERSFENRRWQRSFRWSAVICGLLVSFANQAFADEAQECSADAGTLIIGRVVSAPKFKHGTYRKGVELSHTHLSLKSDADGKTYDVAIDNVFASGYVKHSKAVPAPLDTIRVGDELEVCGQPFPGGIHWVHNNCGDTPTSDDPNGWIRKVSSNGTLSSNFEDAQKYCYLWPRQ